jgi:hypothetical protein
MWWLSFRGGGIVILTATSLAHARLGTKLPRDPTHDDPGECSHDDIAGKDKRQEQPPTQIAPGSGGGQRGAYAHVTHL